MITLAVNKLIFGGEVKFDLTADTVTPQTLAQGVTAHNSKGEPITGTMISGGDSGSGVIDVTELPTSDINENAVYRVTETVQTEKNEIYLYPGNDVYTMQEYLASQGIPTVPNIYVVDTLPADMLPSDVQTFSALHFYILRSDGIAYANVPAYGGIITVGLFGFQDMGYDKGFTKNVYEETEVGFYTTIEAYKQVVRWFIRENSEWKEVTAYIDALTPHGFINAEVPSGNITARVFSGADIISGEYTEIDESWFLKRDGTHIKSIYPYRFRGSALQTLTIPAFIENIYQEVFSHNYDLKNVTFKGTPKFIELDAFSFCDNLTTINVPWSEGEVENAPWGAINATINYNCV